LGDKSINTFGHLAGFTTGFLVSALIFVAMQTKIKKQRILLAIMGGIGFLGGAIAQPVLGAIFDAQTIAAIPAGQTVEALKAAAAGSQEAATWAAAQLTGGEHTLRYVAFVPAVLIVSFTFLHIWKRKHV
jgi:hypothetical protein